LVIASYARALECIPRQLAINAGLDPTTLLNQLRQKHFRANDKAADDGKWFGVDIDNDGICDCYKVGVVRCVRECVVTLVCFVEMCVGACVGEDQRVEGTARRTFARVVFIIVLYC
jgi:hypothetical protein